MENEAHGTNSDLELAPGDDEDDGDAVEDPGQGNNAGGAGGHRLGINVGWNQTMPTSDLPVFTADVGLLRELAPEDLDSPLALFKQFINADMINQACRQTNLYFAQLQAEARDLPHQREWDPVTPPELEAWLGILLVNSLHPYPRMHLYWSSSGSFCLPKVADVMPLKRFEQLKRFLHLTDRSKEVGPREPRYDPLYKVRSWLDAFNQNCREMYSPHRQLSLDEMDISFKGRSQHKQRIKFKRAGDGFLNYALCDATNGYLWSSFFQFNNHIPKRAGLSKTFNAVYQLMALLPNAGHHVFVDNLYSSAILAEELFAMGHLYTCTARKDRVPSAVMQEVAKTKEQLAAVRGTTKWAARGNVIALTYYDAKPVPMLTTAHRTLEEVTFQRRACRLNPTTRRPETVMVDKTRLNVIHDCNSFMDRVDVADQVRTYFPAKLRSFKWWHSIFFWIVDSAASNAYIVHKEGKAARGERPLSHFEFVDQLADALIGIWTSRAAGRSSGRKRRRSAEAAEAKLPGRVEGKHFIEACSSPTAKNPQRDCVVCKMEGRRSRTKFQCDVCGVGLHPECFKAYHQ